MVQPRRCGIVKKYFKNPRGVIIYDFINTTFNPFQIVLIYILCLVAKA